MRNSIFVFIAIVFIAATPLHTIRHNSNSQGIMAGSTHFADLWARDALYASWGAIEKNMTKPVLATIQTLTQYQSSDGQIPLRVGRTSATRALMGLPSERGAVYGNDKTSNPALDPNCLFIITITQYDNTLDTNLAQTYETQISDAAKWLLAQNTQGSALLEEGPYASWDDAIDKNGPSTYSNVCAWRALTDAGYDIQAQALKRAINQELWTGTYFMSSTTQDVLDVPANLFAIHYGFTNNTQTESVLQEIRERKDARNDLLPKTNYEHYRWQDVYFPFFIVGMADYHNDGPYWSWIAALEATVRAEQNDTVYAKAILTELVHWHEHAGGIYEVYETHGEPVDRLFYQSEKDFSWAASLQILAQNALS